MATRRNQKCGIELNADELITLEEMSVHHPYHDFRIRAAGLVLLAKGGTPKAIATRLLVTYQSIYNWTHAWRERGILGLLGGHAGGRHHVLPPTMLDTAVEVARNEALSLSAIAKAVEAKHQCDLPCCLDTLRNGLKDRGFSFKRSRHSLKKNGPKRSSPG